MKEKALQSPLEKYWVKHAIDKSKAYVSILCKLSFNMVESSYGFARFGIGLWSMYFRINVRITWPIKW